MFEANGKVAVGQAAEYREMSELDSDGHEKKNSSVAHDLEAAPQLTRANVVKKIPNLVRCCCGCSSFLVFVIVVS